MYGHAELGNFDRATGWFVVKLTEVFEGLGTVVPYLELAASGFLSVEARRSTAICSGTAHYALLAIGKFAQFGLVLLHHEVQRVCWTERVT